MSYQSKPRAAVILQDGTLFWGRSTGIDGTAFGEICFNTGMTGYQEIFTDPSYFGQIMVTTTAHIGNYGVKDGEEESESLKIAGLICKNFSQKESRPGASGSLAKYFKDQQKVLISDVDTRALVRYIRSRGAMNAAITTRVDDLDQVRKELKDVPSMEGLELASRVTTDQAYTLGSPKASYRLAVWDFGVKQNILRHFTQRDCFLKVFPKSTAISGMLQWDPHGFLISNGPGDPAAMKEVFPGVQEMINSGLPVFGICLGHQLIALSQGLSTYKMHQGHRGINHPVLNTGTGRGEITTQNHGFVVSKEGLIQHSNISLTHQHLNDEGVQGLKLKDQKVSSVQFHPEAYPGPHDSYYLFDQFVELMK